MNIPTLLTLLRILAIPVMIAGYLLPIPYGRALASILFALAAITDWFDGYLARTLKQTTRLGAFLDPVADKLIVASALIVILAGDHLVYLTLPAIFIIGREITVSALREWMAELGKRASMAVTFVAKVKTTIQMIALVLLLWYRPGSPDWLLYLGVLLLYAATILTIWSMVVYLKLAWPELKNAG